MVKTWHTLRGKKFQVDNEDFPLVSRLTWGIAGRINGKGGALVTRLTIGRLLLLKQLIRELGRNPKAEVDHINGNFLDNRKTNLRIVSRSENSHYKWKRMAINRLRRGIKCSLGCGRLASGLVRLPARKYLYLCDEHFVISKHRGQVIPT